MGQEGKRRAGREGREGKVQWEGTGGGKIQGEGIKADRRRNGSHGQSTKRTDKGPIGPTWTCL